LLNIVIPSSHLVEYRFRMSICLQFENRADFEHVTSISPGHSVSPDSWLIGVNLSFYLRYVTFCLLSVMRSCFPNLHLSYGFLFADLGSLVVSCVILLTPKASVRL